MGAEGGSTLSKCRDVFGKLGDGGGGEDGIQDPKSHSPGGVTGSYPTVEIIVFFS